jgi:non-lysosomal glucosylceramidase
MRRSQAYGLPRNLENTYDWWDFAKKDVVSYNAFLHLASLRATERLALAENDRAFAAECRKAFERGQNSLYDRLWTGEYFRESVEF